MISINRAIVSKKAIPANYDKYELITRCFFLFRTPFFAKSTAHAALPLLKHNAVTLIRMLIALYPRIHYQGQNDGIQAK